MPETPAFLDSARPPVPDIVVPRGVTPFYLPRRPVRGRLLRLGPLADALLTRHDNHPAVTRVAGEALALVAGLSTALKFTGSFSLQVKGDGPLNLLLADCDPDPATAALLGEGYFAMTVDQGAEAERHQGIVQITGGSLADTAHHYFETSEQLRCSVRLACAHTPLGWRAGALVLERIAGQGGVDPTLDDAELEASWHTAQVLAATLTEAELLDDTLPAERLLYRLFHGEGVAADRARSLSYGCRCSRQKLSGILEGFGADDLDHMAVDGDIIMTCEFCNLDFRFARADVRGDAAAP
jgi:molecular chaperone Hsp33